MVYTSVLLVRDILSKSPHLRKKQYNNDPCLLAGHCYVASEVLYHFLGGKDMGYKPMFIRYLDEPHWFLCSIWGIIDATAEQFSEPVPYEKARGRGFLTKKPSKRAEEVLKVLRKKYLGIICKELFLV